jgi:hypothetical protein
MKTTLELPEPIFRKAKATAAERGQSLKDFVTEALRDKLALDAQRAQADEPKWMQGFWQAQATAQGNGPRAVRS